MFEEPTVLCGKCGSVLVRTIPWQLQPTTATNPYYCLKCKEYASVVNFIYGDKIKYENK